MMMRINRTPFLTLLTLCFALLLTVSCRKDPEPEGRFAVEPYDNRPGYSERSVTANDMADLVEAALNEEELPEGELVPDNLDTTSMSCVYIAKWNAPAFYDAKGIQWNGISYDGGAFPLVEESDGVMKVVDLNRDKKRIYLYFNTADMAKNQKDTIWYQSMMESKEDPTMTPDVPCLQR